MWTKTSESDEWINFWTWQLLGKIVEQLENKELNEIFVDETIGGGTIKTSMGRTRYKNEYSVKLWNEYTRINNAKAYEKKAFYMNEMYPTAVMCIWTKKIS